MPKLKISLPKELADQPLPVREAVLEQLRQAMKLPKMMEVTRSGGNEHNMWERNDDALLADMEDEFYEYLQERNAQWMAEAFLALGLNLDGVDMEKAFSPEYEVWAYDLRKSPNKRQAKKNAKKMLSDLIEAGRGKREAFIKYLQSAAPMTKKEIGALNKLLKAKLPDYAAKVEAFMARAGMLGKIHNTVERENLQTFGVMVDRFPETIQATKRESVVLTVQEKRKSPKQVTVMPLTPQEARSVEHARQSAASKVQDIDERHRAGVNNIIERAKKERWSVGKLQQTLFDLYGDQNRDWRRVAITESAMATNDAYLSGLSEGEEVIGMGAVNACKYCNQYVVGKKFTVLDAPPSEESYDTEMTKVWAGKSNYGRRVATYIPAIPMHPNCRCRWHRVSRFYEVPKDGGKPTLKPAWQLIQEERVKRGMGLDPNLPKPPGMA